MSETILRSIKRGEYGFAERDNCEDDLIRDSILYAGRQDADKRNMKTVRSFYTR
jgi:hypothetical protein